MIHHIREGAESILKLLGIAHWRFVREGHFGVYFLVELRRSGRPSSELRRLKSGNCGSGEGRREGAPEKEV